MRGRSRLNVRVVKGGSVGPLWIFRSGKPGRPFVRAPVDVAYWDGFRDVFPPCGCLRCLQVMWSVESPRP